MDFDDPVNTWSYAHGMPQAKRDGLTEDDAELIKERWTELCMEQLELRALFVPKGLRGRILWDAVVHHYIPRRLPSIDPRDGYYLVPLSMNGNENDRSTLALPPTPRVGCDIHWPWTAGLIHWVLEPGAGRGAEWVESRLSEFAPVPVHFGIWKCPWLSLNEDDAIQQQARLDEARKRIEKMTPWLEERGMDGLVSEKNFNVQQPGNAEAGLSNCVFLFAVRLSHKDMTLICPPQGDPRLKNLPLKG